jgi:hypothetical protein
MKHLKACRIKAHRYFVSIINIAALLFMAVACNYANSPAIDNGLERVINLLENQNIAQSAELINVAKNIKAEHKNSFANIDGKTHLVGKFDNSDPEKAKKWMRDNAKTLDNAIDKISIGIGKDISEINKLSKNAYLVEDKSIALWSYVMTYFKIQYLRNDLRKSVEILSPLSLVIHSTALTEDTESLALRKKMEEKMLTMLGIGIVIDQDYNQIRSIILNYKENNLLPEALREILSATDKDIINDMKIHSKDLKVSSGDCVTSSSDEKCSKIRESREQIKAQYAQITFLFTPGQKYFLITKLLSYIGNLTWGLANTVIGAGVVVTTMLVSPFTPYVDFPTFHLSESGMQIYVDVTGMSPIRGKMSLGLFELDNGSGFGFASEHEGGHAIQSAILGPLYLPAVLITYALSGFDNGLMENLADEAASASDVWL